jgi:CRISPR-associated endonuclease/helicase Cas3
MTYLAHIRLDKDQSRVEQLLHVHCRNCAQIASSTNVAGLKNAAYLAGLLHDMGKYTIDFQNYLIRSASGEPVHRGSVNHTFAGVRFAMERWHISEKPALRNMVCEIIAVAAGAHHGMFDCIDPDGKDALLYRLKTNGTGYQEARENFLLHCARLDELDKLFNEAEKEIISAMENIKKYIVNESELRFCLGLLTRMLLSAVIDADRRDTVEFMFNTVLPQRQLTREKWFSLLAGVEAKLSEMPFSSSIDQIRRKISDRCREAANRKDGIYRLSIPTGGGKTLSSLRYALAVAAQHRKKRIFFVIPLLSILEQNAAVIREFIGDDGVVLEHHSNIVREKSKWDELDVNELLMETWDYPIVITTLVQLLNTLFNGKTSFIRRMHALADSVIVIDEVQSVPRKMLSLFNMAMNFLAATCNCVILLCSATQPCLEYVSHALHFQEPANLVSINPKWNDTFRRTNIIDKRKKGGYTPEDLLGFAMECMESANSMLIICNTKDQARTIFNSFNIADAEVYHLSTAMCMEHRIHTLAKINLCLEQKRRVICVSTQLVEAGVDFSFACVIRVSAGLDNMIQAAGRCNRNGEFGRRCPVYIVNIHKENLGRLKEIQESQLAAESVMALFDQNPHRFNEDIASDKAISTYYRCLYTNMPSDSQDFPLPHLGTTLYTLLSDNSSFQHHCESRGKYVITQAFKTAGAEFRVFDDNTVDVLVPYGYGERLIADLGSSAAETNYVYRKQLLDKAKRFSVSLYNYEVTALQKSGGLSSLYDSILVLQPEFYSERTGFDLHGDGNRFLEV